jgi:hypothetical protein
MDRYVLLDVDVLGGLAIKSAGDLTNCIQISRSSRRDDLICDGVESSVDCPSGTSKRASKRGLPGFCLGGIAIALRSAAAHLSQT